MAAESLIATRYSSDVFFDISATAFDQASLVDSGSQMLATHLTRGPLSSVRRLGTYSSLAFVYSCTLANGVLASVFAVLSSLISILLT